MTNRYAEDWNSYSKIWEDQYGQKYTNLGDEWNDDGTKERSREAIYFKVSCERWLKPDMTVLEVGPGGGKWTVQIAPLVKKLIVFDVSEEMLKRTRSRCEAEGITNVEYIYGNSVDFAPIPDASIDFFFSYDVYVHIALEDAWPYAQEAARVLVPGGRGSCHYAVNTVPEAYDRIRSHNDYYRFGKHTLGQYYYYSPEGLRRMYEDCGLQVTGQYQESYHCTCYFQKPLAVESSIEDNLLLGKLNRDKAWLSENWQNWQRIAQQKEQELAVLNARLASSQAETAQLLENRSQEYRKLESWATELETQLKQIKTKPAYRLFQKLKLL